MPCEYEKPLFNTPQYWQDVLKGWISEEEQLFDQSQFDLKRRRALDSKKNKAHLAKRHNRPAPTETKQFSKAMSTQAARDDRLTPQSKALLQIIVARTGKGHSTDTTKTTLGAIMSRCPRSIQRYTRVLIKFGYICTQTIESRRNGFYTGIRIWNMNNVLQFYSKPNEYHEPKTWVGIIKTAETERRQKSLLLMIKILLVGFFVLIRHLGLI